MKIIMIDGLVETLTFFSKQMADYFERNGHCVWFWDMHNPLDSRDEFEKIIQDKSEVALCTFNFIGISGETQFEMDDDLNIWDANQIKQICIMVDHPMYYESQLSNLSKLCQVFCVDRDHCDYISKYFTPINAMFFPLGGTELTGDKRALQDRAVDVLFAGNYVSLEGLLHHLDNLDDEMREYLLDIANELIANPTRNIEEEAESRLLRDFPDATFEEIKGFMHNMIFVDLYVRSFYRRKIICDLAEQDIVVHVIGKDWEKAGCAKPENIISHGMSDSLGCLEAMKEAKISLNIMPWFKAGTHDRIYNSMLQGCVTVTDSSKYLDEESIDEYAIIYDIEDTITLARKIKEIKNDIEKHDALAKKGLIYARKNTWEKRAQIIEKIL